MTISKEESNPGTTSKGKKVITSKKGTDSKKKEQMK